MAIDIERDLVFAEFESENNMELSEVERALFERLRKIKNEELFVKAIMLFAWNADCFQELIDAIDAKEL